MISASMKPLLRNLKLIKRFRLGSTRQRMSKQRCFKGMRQSKPPSLKKTSWESLSGRRTSIRTRRMLGMRWRWRMPIWMSSWTRQRRCPMQRRRTGHQCMSLTSTSRRTSVTGTSLRRASLVTWFLRHLRPPGRLRRPKVTKKPSMPCWSSRSTMILMTSPLTSPRRSPSPPMTLWEKIQQLKGPQMPQQKVNPWRLKSRRPRHPAQRTQSPRQSPRCISQRRCQSPGKKPPHPVQVQARRKARRLSPTRDRRCRGMWVETSRIRHSSSWSTSSFPMNPTLTPNTSSKCQGGTGSTTDSGMCRASYQRTCVATRKWGGGHPHDSTTTCRSRGTPWWDTYRKRWQVCRSSRSCSWSATMIASSSGSKRRAMALHGTACFGSPQRWEPTRDTRSGSSKSMGWPRCAENFWLSMTGTTPPCLTGGTCRGSTGSPRGRTCGPTSQECSITPVMSTRCTASSATDWSLEDIRRKLAGPTTISQVWRHGKRTWESSRGREPGSLSIWLSIRSCSCSLA